MTPRMSEKYFQQTVTDMAKLFGWMVYHPYSSQKSTPGYPDLTMVHPVAGRVIFRELKVAGGRPSPAQKKWIAALAAAGADIDVWWPMHLDNGHIQRTLNVRGEQIARGRVA